MRKLIEREQQNLIVCDNPNCDFQIPYQGESEKLLLAFINMPCPKCGEVLLTPEDYLLSEKVLKAVNQINKWFSWLLIFVPRKVKHKSVCVHFHNGIHIEDKHESAD
jgi:hypothetical protein